MEWIEAYYPAIWAMGAAGALLLLQLLVVDFASIKAKHKPGMPVTADSGSFLFRATRAHANTNENISAFVLLAITGIFSSAAPVWLNGLCWAYVLCRVAYMLFYYANKGMLRSTVFAFGLAALLGLLAVDVVAWLR